MSMDSIGASGYVANANEFIKFIPENLQKDYLEAIENRDFDAVNELLGESVPENFPTFEGAFVLGDEDTADNLERGVVYVCFQDDDLFKPKELNSFGEFLKSNGIIPEFERWSQFG